MTSKTKEIFEEGNWTMLKGFKKSVDVDFIVSKNRVKMEEAFKQVEKECRVKTMKGRRSK